MHGAAKVEWPRWAGAALAGRSGVASHDRLHALKRLQGGEATASFFESAKVPLAFAGWYLMSIVYSVLNKEVLTVWKFPCVFSAVQLLIGSVFVGLLWTPLPTFGMREKSFAPIREPPKLSMAQLMTVSQVALWLALGHIMSTVAPAYGTVAFTNVVKTLEPLFTCLFSAIFLNQIFALPVKSAANKLMTINSCGSLRGILTTPAFSASPLFIRWTSPSFR